MQSLMPYTTMAVTALAVLTLLIGSLLLYKMLSRSVRGRRGARLGISEYHEIDKNRRLVLVRRDDVEHLLLIGGEQDIVVESRIESGLYSAPTMPVTPQVSAHPANLPQNGNIQALPLRPPPRPPVFGERRAPLRSIDPAISVPRPDNDSD